MGGIYKVDPEKAAEYINPWMEAVYGRQELSGIGIEDSDRILLETAFWSLSLTTEPRPNRKIVSLAGIPLIRQTIEPAPKEARAGGQIPRKMKNRVTGRIYEY